MGNPLRNVARRETLTLTLAIVVLVATIAPLTGVASAAEPRRDAELIARAMAFTEPFEGRRHRAYRDSTGHATVGVGFNLDRPGAREDLARLLPAIDFTELKHGRVRLSDAQIDALLRHDIARAIETARREVPNLDGLPDPARLIVIDMTFNLGSLKAWPRFRAALAAHDFARAADEMHDSRWRRQTGRRAAAHIRQMRGLATR